MKHQKEARWPATPSKFGGELPPSSGNSHCSAFPWEMQFCSQIPWTKFCECKKLSFLFENVLNWDDSSGKEAFDNAKTRFWAEINGLRCDIPFPDPDVHIDMVNQDTFLDPRLMEDLYKLPPPPPQKEVPDYNSIEIIPTGWDVDDAVTAGVALPVFISAGDDQPAVCGNFAATTPAERSCRRYAENRIHEGKAIDELVTIVPTGWGDEEDLASSHAWNPSKQREDAFNVDSWGVSYSGARDMDPKDGDFIKSRFRNSTKDRSGGNGRDSGRRLSSKHARPHGGCYRANESSRGCCGGRRLKYSDECCWHDKGLSCAPANNHT